MADEIKQTEISTKVNNSEIHKIKEPDFSKEVVIDRVHLLPKHVYEQHRSMMKKTLGNKVSEEEIARRINSLVIRDAIFNEAMKILVPCYEIKIDPKDIDNFVALLRKVQPNLLNAPDDYVKLLARRTIEKEMIFIVLAKEWNVNVTDDDARKVLMDYYKATNESVREKLNDQAELDRIKTTLLEQTLANRICSMLKYKVDMEAITKNAEEDKRKAEEYFKKAQEAKPENK